MNYMYKLIYTHILHTHIYINTNIYKCVYEFICLYVKYSDIRVCKKSRLLCVTIITNVDTSP